MKKKIYIIIVAFIISCPFSVTAEEGGLNGLITDGDYTYYYINGVKQTGFQVINGDTYFFSRVDGSMRTGIFSIDYVMYWFDDNGVMQTGFYEENGKKYYFDENGRASGFKKIGDNTYFFSRVDGSMRTGVFSIDYVMYWFDNDGIMQTGWYEEDGNKYYFDENGRASGFKKIGDNTYFFSRVDDNRMRTGIFDIDGYTYYFDKDGVMQTGFQYVDGKTKYFLEDGKMAKGVIAIGNDYYGFDDDGVMLKGWYDDSGNKYYFDNDGKAVKGLWSHNNKTYYFNQSGIMHMGFQVLDDNTYFFSRVDGAMRTGMFDIDGYTYYFLEDGKMYTGWYETEEGSRYFASNGQMQKGIVDLNGSKYFFDSNGIQAWGFQQYNGNTYFFSRVGDHSMRTGFFQVDYIYYYFNSEGVMQTGFQNVEGIMRFFSRVNGAMRTGWTLIDGYMYYFDPNTGEMTVGNKTIDNVNYVFYDDGRLRDGFVTDTDGNTRYYYPDGSFANDWVTIAGTKYFFNSLGVMIGKNVKKVIDVSEYQKEIDWDTVISHGGVDGVILRISASGLDREDAMLARNIAALQRLGIPYGIYIYSYAENYNEGRLYADFTLNIIRKYNMNPTLGIYLDLESNNITSYMGVYEYEQVTRGFMDVMNNNGYGNLSKIYTYTSMAEGALNSPYLHSLIAWVAQYNHYCYYTGSYVGWQYSSTEYIPGIEGNVDVSVWFN